MALLDLPDNHDLNHLRLALEFVREFDVAVDCGAHRGIWTNVLMQNFKTVYAFEPQEDLIQKNPATEKYCCALGETYGKCSIEDGKENTGQAHVVYGEDVDVLPLDALEIENVNFLKIDVEGYELSVLKGAYETIIESHPVILLEKNGLSERYGVKDTDIDNYLADLGYKNQAKWNKDYLYIT